MQHSVSCLLLSPRQVSYRFGLGALTQYTWVYPRWTATGGGRSRKTKPDRAIIVSALFVRFFKLLLVES